VIMKYRIIGMVVVVLALAGGWLFVQTSHAKQFSETAWKSCETNEFGIKVGNVRRRMLNDLTERVLTTGMPRTRILSMLGPPDNETRDTNSTWLQYYVGQDSRLDLLPQLYYLDLCFDTNGSLKTHRLEAVK